VESFLKIEPMTFSNAAKTLGAGHVIGNYAHLMQRVDEKMLDALFEVPDKLGSEPEFPAGKSVSDPNLSLSDPNLSFTGGEEISPII
jgi:methionyl-tRNA synthetase